MPAGGERPTPSRLIFVIACEPSGDALGAGLMNALKTRSPDPLRFAGVGGARMAAEGLHSLCPLGDLAVMGLAEVLPRLPLILRRQRQIVREILERRPDIVVTIDSSSFNKGVARRLIRAKARIPRVHYVAPMVWAWRPGRVHGMAARFDHLMTLFPFEPPLFEAAGLPSTCVGHPAVEAPPGDGPAFRLRHGIAADAPLLCLLPGSRPAEVERLLPVFREALAILAGRLPGLYAVVPSVSLVADRIRDAVAGWPVPVRIVLGEEERRDAFAAADAALAASGTVTLELALASVPMVVAYRLNPITGWLAARLIRIPHVALVNILLGRRLVPELLRGDCEPQRLADAVLPLFTDEAARQAQRDGFGELRRRLSGDGRSPSQVAADLVLALATPARPLQSPEREPCGGGE